VSGDHLTHTFQHLPVDLFGRDMAAETGIVHDITGLIAYVNHLGWAIVLVEYQAGK
jgi:hypothetical protein